MTEEYEIHLIFEWKFSDEGWVRVSPDNDRPHLEIDYMENDDNDEL